MESAYRSPMESSCRSAAETTANAAAMPSGESTASVSTAAGMPAAAVLSVGRGNQTRGAQSSEERDL